MIFIKDKKINKKVTLIDTIWIISFLAFFALILNKCRYGIACFDEHLYLAVPYRFTQGSRFFIDEWNFSQFSAVITFPIVKLYMALFKTTEGILLNFRYIFTILHGITSVWLYKRLRNKGVVAVFVSIVYLIFVPFGIMALSYNSMSIAFMTICCFNLYTSNVEKPIVWIISGITFALAVLCTPYLIIEYGLFIIFCIILHFTDRKKHWAISKTLNLKSAFLFTLGCAIAATAFFIFVLINSDIKGAIEGFSLAFGFTSHGNNSGTFFEWIKRFIYGIYVSNSVSRIIFPLSLLLLIIILLDKKRKNRNILYFIFACVLTYTYLFSFIYNRAYINCYMFALPILGFFCFILKPKETGKEFGYLWVPSMVYAFCFNCTSDTKFLATSDGATIATLGTIIILFMFIFSEIKIEKIKLKKTIYIYSLWCTLTGFVISLAFARHYDIFFDTNGLKDKTEVFTVGALKGIHTSRSYKDLYDGLYEDTNFIREFDGNSVLYYTKYYSWLYLEDSKKTASFSAWLPINADNTRDKLKKYYSSTNNLPSIVYMEKCNEEENMIMYDYFEQLGYEKGETKDGIYLIAPKGEKND